MPERYDVIIIIIGTGAGSGTLAHRLAPSGNKVLVLERGGYLGREPGNAQYYVGGNTKFYGAFATGTATRATGARSPRRGSRGDAIDIVKAAVEELPQASAQSSRCGT
jgi:choline dehydrogenase-like flavoprotein